MKPPAPVTRTRCIASPCLAHLPGRSWCSFPEGSARLAGSFAAPGDHCLCGGHQDLEIECRTEGLGVVNVQVYPFLHGVNPPRDHLPESGHSRLDAMSHVLPRLVPGHYRRQFRPGADQAHLPPDNIEKLREFVQAPAPQEPPDPRMPGIILCLMRATTIRKRNRHLGTASFREHRPELENV